MSALQRKTVVTCVVFTKRLGQLITMCWSSTYAILNPYWSHSSNIWTYTTVRTDRIIIHLKSSFSGFWPFWVSTFISSIRSHNLLRKNSAQFLYLWWSWPNGGRLLSVSESWAERRRERKQERNETKETISVFIQMKLFSTWFKPQRLHRQSVYFPQENKLYK